MNKIINREFFKEKSEEVAYNLVGKYICHNNKYYQIIETEAYYHNEKDVNGKYFCYGVKDDTGEYSKTCASIPLFRNPGTWCIYGGQLLLSVTNSKIPDNVLIKRVKTTDNKDLGPNDIAYAMKLYQKCENSNYWNFHGLDSLSDDADLYLVEDEIAPNFNRIADKRVNINDSKLYNYKLDSK